MFYKSLTVLLFVVLWASAHRGQTNDTAAYPTHPLAPVIIPWEPNGADYKLHTRELDSRPFPAHRIIANVYYVGTSGYSMFLITSDEGHILIDTGYASFVPLLQKNMEQLGFRFQDIKIVLLPRSCRPL